MSDAEKKDRLALLREQLALHPGLFDESSLNVNVNYQVAHVTPDVVKMQIAVARAKYVEPITVQMRYLLAFLLIVIVFLLIIFVTFTATGKLDTWIGVALVAAAGTIFASVRPMLKSIADVIGKGDQTKPDL